MDIKLIVAIIRRDRSRALRDRITATHSAHHAHPVSRLTFAGSTRLGKLRN